MVILPTETLSGNNKKSILIAIAIIKNVKNLWTSLTVFKTWETEQSS